MESIMEYFQGIFGEGFDLAAVASGAGLFGGGASAALAWMVSGAIMKFILRTVLTAILTGGGFLFLLHYLGFQIVPPPNFQNINPYARSLDATEMKTEEMADIEEDEDKKSCRITFRRLKH